MSTCNILGTVKDLSNALEGELRVTLANPVLDTDTTPVTTHLEKQTIFTITGGIIDINLPETETQQITASFEFWPVNADTDTGFDNQAAIAFNAMIPNTATAQFSDLIPSGITSDTLDSSIQRLARVIVQNPDLLDDLAQAVAPYVNP